MDPSLFLGILPFVLEGEEFSDSPKGTLDAVTFSVVASRENWRSELEDLGIARLARLPISFGYYAMWVSDFKVSQLSPNTATIAVSCLGLLQEGEDKRKTTIAATSNRASIGPDSKPSGPLTDMTGAIIEQNLDGSQIVGSDGVLVWRQDFPSRIFGETTTSAPAWSIPIPRITLTSLYFTTLKPAENVAGTEVASEDMPAEIDAPGNPFTDEEWTYLNFRLNAKAGWLYDSRNIDPLFTGPATAAPGDPASGLWAVTDVISHYQGAEPM